MRIFLIALLFAISYAQTELKSLHSNSDLVLSGEIALGGGEDVKSKFPEVYLLCKRQRTVDLHPGGENFHPIKVTFLQPIAAGLYGAVAKATADGEEIAFKFFKPRASHSQLNPPFVEAQIMATLANSIVDVVKPKLGTKIHQFKIDEITYKGFGMELFPHGTLAEYFEQELKHFPKDPMQRLYLIQNPTYFDLYWKIFATILEMWTLGIVHGDLHIGNILFDPAERQYKLIDFGFSQQPDRFKQKKFYLGVVADFAKFTMTFVMGILYTDHLIQERTKEFGRSDWKRICSATESLNKQMRHIYNGYLPRSSDFKTVFRTFRHMQGIEDDKALFPSPQQIKEASYMTQPDWNLMDSGADVDFGEVFFDGAEAPQTPHVGEASDATLAHAYKSPETAPAPATPATAQIPGATPATAQVPGRNALAPGAAQSSATPATAQVPGRNAPAPGAAQSSAQRDPAAAPAGDPTASMEGLKISETVPEEVSQSLGENQKRDIFAPYATVSYFIFTAIGFFICIFRYFTTQDRRKLHIHLFDHYEEVV